jgi:hypothetical protein
VSKDPGPETCVYISGIKKLYILEEIGAAVKEGLEE